MGVSNASAYLAAIKTITPQSNGSTTRKFIESFKKLVSQSVFINLANMPRKH